MLSDSSPASMFCSTERSVLCQNCDYKLHDSFKNSNAVHDTPAAEGFDGCPTVSQLITLVGFENFDVKSLLASDGVQDLGSGFFGGCGESDQISNFLVWDAPAIVNIDELIISTDKSRNFRSLCAPPLPKDHNWTRGKHEQEILYQL
ncbi:hypothetical protein Ancab_021730 [Ancistrocladus abbreviatus]